MSETVPLVGLPARMDLGKAVQYLGRQYADAVIACGGIPVLIPLLHEPRALSHLAEKLDGILLTGNNSDVDPKHYGARPIEACGPVQQLRDQTDFLLLEVALGKRLPLFAICFGMQSLNVFMGGDLIQDIPSQLQTGIQHSNSASKGRPSHGIEILSGSILERLAGGNRVMVNSTHHQAVGRLGRDLEVVARAPDGVIESIAGTSADSWIFGVQWHPERSFSFDPLSKNIFRHFLDCCRAR